MRIKEHQHHPNTGRFPKYYLPDFDIETYLMGQYLLLASIQSLEEADLSGFYADHLFENPHTCQKNGGEK